MPAQIEGMKMDSFKGFSEQEPSTPLHKGSHYHISPPRYFVLWWNLGWLLITLPKPSHKGEQKNSWLGSMGRCQHLRRQLR
eukprot:2746000-Amphidinium_carterae.1